ncbi:uncharacterized protein DEA37_0010217 [Paragonimus westermani]|uniref:Uncharacterized protein n=1 Tax=Paragonimus westermani TaxID=34504 RepID=A0A5J4N5R5_9TREM|nr:uncharacterized protein DEA37_0010217 [Paragonimus westermani]
MLERKNPYTKGASELKKGFIGFFSALICGFGLLYVSAQYTNNLQRWYWRDRRISRQATDQSRGT